MENYNNNKKGGIVMYIETFKFKGVNLDIYKTDKGFTINDINFYDNIKDLKDSCKELIRKMRYELLEKEFE